MDARILPHQLGYDPYYKIWHSLSEHMLIYMHSSGGCIVTQERIYPIERGVLCFIGAGKNHYTMPNDPRTYDRTKAFLTREELTRLRPLLPPASALAALGEDLILYATVSEEEEKQIEEIFAEMERGAQDPEYGDPLFLAGCLRLFTYLGRRAETEKVPPRGPIAVAIDYIHTHLKEDLSLADIGRAVHISKHHFCRRFKEATGATVMEYILRTRLALAKQLLLKEEVSVGTVSEVCGFSSTSYFCRTFKADTGLSPLAYRKANLGS